MIHSELKKFVEIVIIPEYEAFDKAHDSEHVRRVMQNSLTIAADYDVDINMVYAIAAYHDLGLKYGRDGHEKASGTILREDKRLAAWFSEEQIQIMAEAAEDHRASSKKSPRSLYGKIISEADRDLEYITIMKRTLHYSLANFPEMNCDEHFERSFSHMKEKYGVGGYMKLCLQTKKNQEALAFLQEKLENKNVVREDFQGVFAELTAK